MQWEKVKKAGIAPSPRTNFGLVTHKKRAVLFGGITDQHGRGDRMYSSMHDELYQLNLETQRWYPIAVKAPAKSASKASGKAAASKDSQAEVSKQVSDKEGLQPADGTSPARQDDATDPDQATSSSRLDPDSSGAASTAAHESEGHAGRDARQTGPGSGTKQDGVADAAGDRQASGAVQPDLATKLSDAGVDKNSALYKAAARIQSRFRGYTVRKVRLLLLEGTSRLAHTASKHMHV